MLALHIVIFSHEVVVNLLEESLLVGRIGLQRLPVVGEMLVVAHLFDRADEVLPAVAVEERELLIGELIVPFALDLVEGQHHRCCQPKR